MEIDSPSSSPKNTLSPFSSKQTVKRFKLALLKRRFFRLNKIYSSKLHSTNNGALNSDIFAAFNQFASHLTKNTSIENLNLSGIMLNSLLLLRLVKSLEMHPTLNTLDISNNNISTLGYKHICNSLQFNKILRCIKFANNSISDESFRDLNNLIVFNKGLNELNFNFSKIGEEGLKMYLNSFLSSSSLYSIKLSNIRLKETGLKALSYCLTKSNKMVLEEVDLSHNSIGENELDLLKSKFPKKIKKKQPSVKNLNLQGNKINGENAINKIKYMIERINGLKKLVLGKNNITGSDLENLSGIFSKVSDEINLSNNKLGIAFPAHIDFWLHIKILDLSKNNLTSYPIKNIAEQLERVSWTTLILSGCSLNDEDFIYLIKPMAQNLTLISLDISSNLITDKSLEILPLLGGKLSVKDINFSKNRFENNGLANLFNERSVFLKKVILNDYPTEKELSFTITNYHNNINLKHIESLTMIKAPLFMDKIITKIATANQLIELKLNKCDGILNNVDIINLSSFLRSTKTLKILDLESMNLGGLIKNERKELLEGFSANKSIEKLIISRNKLGVLISEFLKIILKIPQLASLNISSNNIENNMDSEIADFIEMKQNLKEFDISNNYLTYTTFEKISKALDTHTSLEILRIGHMQLDIFCLLVLGPALSNNKSLKVLDFSDAIFEEESILTLCKRKENTIKILKVMNLKFEEFQFNLLFAIMQKNLNNLTHINLCECVLAGKMIHDLTKILFKIKQMQYLNLSGTSVNDTEIAEILIKLTPHERIEELVLKNMDFKNRSYIGLASFLKSNITLKKLDLSENFIKTFYLKNLEESLKFNNFLEEISFNNCMLNNECIKIFLKIFEINVNLTVINLEKNNFINEDIQALFKPKRKVNTPFKLLNIKNNKLFSSTPTSRFTFDNVNIQELNLSHSIKNKNNIMIENFLERLFTNNHYLKNLNLSNNDLTDNILEKLSILLSTDQNLESLTLSKNKFTINGLQSLLKGLEKNNNLKILNLEENLRKESDTENLENILPAFFNQNKSIEILDISNFYLKKSMNDPLKYILNQNLNLCLVNSNWQNIRTSTAIAIIEAMERKFRKFQKQKLNYEKLRKFNFPNCKLDDDFCVYMSEKILKYDFVEQLTFNNNPKITLIGLKNIYVNLIYFKTKLSFKNIYFEKIDYTLALNNGVAASLAEWGKFGNETQKSKIFWQKVCAFIFSKMVAVNNKFQYSESFQIFSRKFQKIFIWFFCLINFLCYVILSVSLPITSMSVCGEAQKSHSHYTYSIYIFITVVIEFIFWLYYKYHIKDYSESDRRLKREIFLNDVLFMFSSLMAKYDLYLDVTFVTVSYSCDYYKTALGSLIILACKLLIKSSIFSMGMYKLLLAIIRKKELTALNTIAKLCMIQDFYLIGDILDRYVPGNSKKIKRFCCKKFKRTINISFALLCAFMKLFIEDLPQAIIQFFYVFVNAKYGKSSQTSSHWIIIVNISKNIVSLLGSFYGSASVRPSYLEQSDFDHALSFVTISVDTPRKTRRSTNLLVKGFENGADVEIERLKETIRVNNQFTRVAVEEMDKGNLYKLFLLFFINF